LDSGQPAYPDGKFKTVSVGGRQSCGVTTTGIVKCWDATPAAGEAAEKMAEELAEELGAELDKALEGINLEGM
jgi:hypothetical protein